MMAFKLKGFDPSPLLLVLLFIYVGCHSFVFLEVKCENAFSTIVAFYSVKDKNKLNLQNLQGVREVGRRTAG